MKTTTGTRDRIIDEAVAALGELGVSMLTVGSVAERAKVSTALVHYHFDTKARLLVAAAARLAARRTERRRVAFAALGLAALDALWSAIEDGSRTGSERAQMELRLHARHDADLASALAGQRAAERAALVLRLPALFDELQSRMPAAAEELAAALDAQLDGVTLALLSGEDPRIVRAASDAFWLTLLAAGQNRRR